MEPSGQAKAVIQLRKRSVKAGDSDTNIQGWMIFIGAHATANTVFLLEAHSQRHTQIIKD